MVTPSYETIHTYSASFASCVLCIGLREHGKMSIQFSGYATEPTPFASLRNIALHTMSACVVIGGRLTR